MRSAVKPLAVGVLADHHGDVHSPRRRDYPIVYAYPLVIFIAGWLMSVRAAPWFAMLSSLAVGCFRLGPNQTQSCRFHHPRILHCMLASRLWCIF